MAIHSSILVRRTPWTEEPGGYSLWRHRVGYDWETNLRFSLFWSSLSLSTLNFFSPLPSRPRRELDNFCVSSMSLFSMIIPQIILKTSEPLGLQPLLLLDPPTEAHHPLSLWSPGLRSHLGESDTVWLLTSDRDIAEVGTPGDTPKFLKSTALKHYDPLDISHLVTLKWMRYSAHYSEGQTIKGDNISDPFNALHFLSIALISPGEKMRTLP